jgi:hypothetical protein
MPTPIEQLSDRELDVLVAEKVMEMVACDAWEPHRLSAGTYYKVRPCDHAACYPAAAGPAEYSQNISAAWQVVRAIQEQHPGWRFSLLGGDTSMGYASDGKGNFLRDKKHNLIVVEDSRIPFGWHAEFFGQLDPRGDYGDRHGTARADTPARAICLTALRARGVEEAEDGT